ncbi:MAG: hypothetical protein GX294_04025 [Candidatus Cloacimonetes bacterium]|nr:hypothetical protein [Candidatus Cloacimonadota bacterium]
MMKITGLLILILTSLIACTQKSNPTGNSFSDVEPIIFVDEESFDLGFSYGLDVNIKGSESNLLCGDYNGMQAAAIMQFVSLPQDFVIPTSRSYADSAWIKLTVLRQAPLSERNPTTLTLYKINEHWREDSAHEAMDLPLQQIGESFTLPDSINTSGTDVKIPFPIDVLTALNEAGEDSLSIVIKTNADAFMEFRSISTAGRGPQLRFKYRKVDEDGNVADSDSEYSLAARKDSYWVKGAQNQVLADEWIIGNLSPSRIFVRWVDNWNHFKDADGNVLSETRRKQVTINKAELIFHTKSNPYYGDLTPYSIKASMVTRDSINTAMHIADEDMNESVLGNISVVKEGTVRVDITAFMQGIVNGKKDNHGFVIHSTQEMNNFGILELEHFLNAPDGKKPQLRVIYTPPFL